MTIKHTSHARYELWYHLAWATKYRKQVFNNPHTCQQVIEIIRFIANQYDMEIGKIDCVLDHIHMSVSAPPRIAPSQVAQIFKSISTKILFQQFPWLKKQYWGGEIWAAGYFVRSIGPGITKETIDRYIEEQSKEL